MSRRRKLIAAQIALAAVVFGVLAIAFGFGDDDGDGPSGPPSRALAIATSKDGTALATIERLENRRWRAALAREGGDGELDVEGATALPLEHPAAIVRQPDGKLVVAGERVAAGRRRLAVLRMTAGGRLDPAFGRDGIVAVSAGDGDVVARGVTIDSDGGVVLAGDATFDGRAGIAVARIRADGRPAGVDRIVGATAAGAATTRRGDVLVAGTDARDGRVVLARLRGPRPPKVTRTRGGDLRSTTWRAVAARPDGGAVVVGSGRDRRARSQVAVQAFEPGGAPSLAVAARAGEGDAYAASVAADNEATVVGATGVESDRPSAFAIRLDPGGNLARAVTLRAGGRVAGVTAAGGILTTTWEGATPTAAYLAP